MAEQEAGSAIDIYNTLSAGKAVRLSFSCKEEVASFRNLIAVTKTRQDRIAESVGLFDAEDRLALTVQYLTKDPPIVAVFAFKERKPRGRTLSYYVVEEDEE